MIRRIGAVLATLSRERQVIAIVFGIVALFGIGKLIFALPIPIFDLQIPAYGALLGLGLIVVGVFKPDPRGLILTAGGTFIAAASGVAMLTMATERFDVLIYGLPLALLGGAGLGAFCHSVLYGQPTMARAGMSTVLAGFVVAVVLYGALWLRGAVRGDDATRVIAGITAVAAAVVALTVATAARAAARRG